MFEDRTINGQFYRVIVDAIGSGNPEGPILAVFVGEGEIVVGAGGKLRKGTLKEIYKKKCVAGEEANLMQEGWFFAQHHASNS